MAHRQLFQKILKGVCSKKILEPFSPKDVKHILGNSMGFLHKHRIGNGTTTELFEHLSRGKYRINPKKKTCP